MSQTATRRGLANRLILATFLASCSTAPPPIPSASPSLDSTPGRGGTLRVVMPRDVPLTSSSFLVPAPQSSTDEPLPPTLDPHVDWWYDALELLRCCLARTLLSTNGRSASEEGAILRPDLASALPEISADGLAWTFKLKPGLHYGPPLEATEITAGDFVRGFHRLLAPRLAEAGSPGAFTFGDIVGAADYAAGDASAISGLETPDGPDAHTLVIRLERPAGDLGARLANPMASPIPPHPNNPAARFGVAEGHDADYGRFLVSSGPYIIEGSEELDFSLPADQQAPAGGLRQGESIVVVRNPEWNPATDGLRPANADRIEIRIVATVEEAVAELDQGRADLVFNPTVAPTIPVARAEAARTDPSRGRLNINEFDAVRGVAMNTAQPPFDDVHVRRAVGFVLNRARLIERQGGPFAYRVAGHIAPEVMLNNLLVDYNPFSTPTESGDLAKARAEMSQSAYDGDHDGTCDGDACAGVVVVSRDDHQLVGEAVVEDLAQIGIRTDHRVVDRAEWFEAHADPTQHVALFTALGWAKDSVSASTFFQGQFYGPAAISSDMANFTLVGATPEQLETWGYERVEVPNVDDRIEACISLVGNAQYECWAAIDQHMMENVVAIVPFASELFTVLAAPTIVEYRFDQLAAAPAFEQIAVAR